MKKTWILFAVVAMIAALLAAPGTALAAKGGHHGNRPDKTPGVTCAEFPVHYSRDAWSSFSVWSYLEDGATFIVDLGPGDTACWDISGTPEGLWEISVSSEYVRSLVLQIKDSVPGDICWKTQLGPGPLGATVTAREMPAAGFNACGEEWSDDDPGLVFAAGSGETGKGKKATKVETVTIKVTLP